MSESKLKPHEVEQLGRHWFGIRSSDAIASTALLMERDRVEQYMGALDAVEHHFGRGYGGLSAGDGVFHGITGQYRDLRLTVIYSIGPAHVADCVSYLAEYFGVTQLVATGSVGGLGSTQIGNIVVANRVMTQDGFSLALYAADAELDPVLGYKVEIKMERDLTMLLSAKHFSGADAAVRVGEPVFTVPAVCLETPQRLRQIREGGYAAIDLETGPFLSACKAKGVEGAVIHWVTDLPESFSFHHSGQERAFEEAKALKYKQWLNMPRIVLPILYRLCQQQDRPHE